VQYIDTETATIDETIALIEKSIALLEEYKTSLILHVVTGKIKIS
jgi:type I restriction enzyme S subunit